MEAADPELSNQSVRLKYLHPGGSKDLYSDGQILSIKKKSKKNSHLEHSKPSHLEPQYLEHPIYVLSVSV